MVNFIDVYKKYINEIIFKWELFLLEKDNYKDCYEIIENNTSVLQDTFIALSYFLKNENTSYYNPSERFINKLIKLSKKIFYSINIYKIEIVCEQINMLKYSIIDVTESKEVLTKEEIKGIYIFFDILYNEFIELIDIKKQEDVKVLARPILNLESIKNIYDETLNKIIVLFNPDYSSIYMCHDDIVIMDNTFKYQDICFYKVDYNNINLVLRDKITYIKIVEKKSKLYNYTQVSTPVIVDCKVYAVINLHYRCVNNILMDDKNILEIIASQMGIAINTLLLYKKLQKSYDTIIISNKELTSIKKKLEDNNKKLMELDRVKSNFIANMSHELRTPLNTIIGFSDLLMQNIKGKINKQDISDLNNINKSGKYLLRLINDILDLSKIEANKMKLYITSVDVYEIVLNAKVTLDTLINNKNIDVKFDVPKDIPMIYGDETRINQVVYNIIGNAEKFTPQGYIYIKAYLESENVVISIEDTGIGIKKEDYDKVFERFSQVEDTKEKGTGLGMTISRELVKIMHGDIYFESEYGKGTTFYVSFPIYKK